MRALIETFTNFGDLAVLLPLVAVVTIWLIAARQRQALAAWLAAVALCLGATAVLKVYFFLCPPLPELHSPSGHTSLSTLVYGSLTLALAAAVAGPRRWAVAAAGAAFIVGIGLSRIAIHAHSLLEVVVGSLIGSLALALFAGVFWRHRPPEPRVQPLAMVCVALMVVLNGEELRAEEFLRSLGLYLTHAGLACI